MTRGRRRRPVTCAAHTLDRSEVVRSEATGKLLERGGERERALAEHRAAESERDLSRIASPRRTQPMCIHTVANCALAENKAMLLNGTNFALRHRRRRPERIYF